MLERFVQMNRPLRPTPLSLIILLLIASRTPSWPPSVATKDAILPNRVPVISASTRLSSKIITSSALSTLPQRLSTQSKFDHLSLLTLSSSLNRNYAQLLASYRDIAILKSLNWRMIKLFKWLINTQIDGTGQAMPQSPIFSMAKDLM